MHFVVMGCGRVGASLARSLDSYGHSVSVVDQNPDAFVRLGKDFSGSTITGLGFDRDTLTRARTGDAYAFAAVSSGDNSNILAARVARETFGVANVAARIYDPRRAQIFERLGIPTVATVRWTADQMLRRLIPQGAATEFRDSSGRMVLAEVHLNPDWIARPVAQIESAVEARVCFVTRAGEGLLPKPGMLVQEGDLVHLMCAQPDLEEIVRALDQPIEEDAE
ncbi:TrkA family potassium uptake protein [Brevibacterium sp. 5221]|uniref:TrkA family potassium uptake protein n=1 Tax=Brevibacterium rongguiense TaxID=2695267 RepID=A0A6N9H9R7_9MICO|nr:MULTISPECIES: TrkA family potassium uptake protein [Brevibacterium]MYM20753.1 TrkA family potassium uptake protein [Brevibacterium rongguiense]WAL41049.1 TrkA family potassium uptake protein [Brevibacterium sp. BRM-1]